MDQYELSAFAEVAAAHTPGESISLVIVGRWPFCYTSQPFGPRLSFSPEPARQGGNFGNNVKLKKDYRVMSPQKQSISPYHIFLLEEAKAIEYPNFGIFFFISSDGNTTINRGVPCVC